MDIIIIGGGAAGLMAARKLSSAHRVTVLEAKETLGGRIKTIGNREGGAEFIHGKLPVTLDLLKEAGLTYTAVSGEMFRVEKNNWEQNEEMIEEWDELLKCMEGNREDMTLLEFLNLNFPQERHAELRNMTIRYAQGFDLADVDKVSVKSLYEEWSSEDEHNYHLDQGYASLIDFLSDECKKQHCNIITRSLVKTILWEKDKITLTTADGETYHANKIIVTVSLGMLQKSAIKFVPAVDHYIQAANSIGWGNVIKVVLTFTHCFWEEDRRNVGFIFSKEEVPTWWTQAPDQAPVLTGWLGGPPSAKYKNKDLLSLALHSLSEIFQLEVSALKRLLVSSLCIDWSDDPDVGGAYSYDTPLSDQARQLLNTPLNDTIYFAGEGCYSGKHPGTVEAALISGMEVAKKIK